MPDPLDGDRGRAEDEGVGDVPRDLGLAWFVAIVGGLMLVGLIFLACVSLRPILHHLH